MDLHFVDGTYELFRAFYGAPKARTGGREVGASRGFLRSMIALLHEPGVTHVAVATDHVIESFRNEMFDGYKTGEGIEPDLWSQAPTIERIVEALGVVLWPVVEFEADDALGTAAVRYAEDDRVGRIFLCTPDKDMAQCVRGDRVVMLDRMRRRVVDEKGVVEKWGVGPDSIPDLLGLMGDTADGIPGIKRWGAKSCAAVLGAYGSIDAIPSDPDEWKVTVRGAKGLSANLEADREAARLYRDLATLRTDVPLAESVDDLAWQGADRAALEAVAREIGAERDLERIGTWRS